MGVDRTHFLHVASREFKSDYLFQRSLNPGWVIGLGIATAILFLTRYVGIFMAAVWLPLIVLLSKQTNRLKNAILFLVGLLPLGEYPFAKELPAGWIAK